MKSFLYIIIILIVLVVGINIGSENTNNNNLNIQDKIDIFENNIQNNNIVTSQTIEPNILNEVAKKCNNGLDELIDKFLEKLIK